jgi:hypothetical protein
VLFNSLACWLLIRNCLFTRCVDCENWIHAC